MLSVAGMDRILEISADDELAVVEPGVINADLNAALEPYGLWFAPDPASKAISTVGGNIATNAGGLLCAKYGVTREAVLALDVVLADGRLIRTGHRTVKGVTGFDLTALFVGSEGTLGVIVGATVRVLPIPPGTPTTIGALFPDVRSAAAAAARVTASRLRPAVMELLDGPSLERISAYLGEETIAAGVRRHRRRQLPPHPVRRPVARRRTPLRPPSSSARPAAPCEVSADADAGRAPARHPPRLPSGARRHRAGADRGRLRAALADARDVRGDRAHLRERYGIPIPTVAHAGDGNLHPNFVYTAARCPPSVWDAANDLFRTAIELGGTLTGEHGVGVLKRRWLADELGPDSYDLQVKLKSVFDPLGILNPGKVFG